MVGKGSLLLKVILKRITQKRSLPLRSSLMADLTTSCGVTGINGRSIISAVGAVTVTGGTCSPTADEGTGLKGVDCCRIVGGLEDNRFF